jgi:hypothetical protein
MVNACNAEVLWITNAKTRRVLSRLTIVVVVGRNTKAGRKARLENKKGFLYAHVNFALRLTSELGASWVSDQKFATLVRDILGAEHSLAANSVGS